MHRAHDRLHRASLDTTINAISNTVHLLGAHPKQWDLHKNDPCLIANGLNETLRYKSPLRAFARLARPDTHIAGVPIPVSFRDRVMYAHANKDEREWNNPDSFDIRSDAGRHLGFGNAAHACAGQALARLETAAMLRA